MRRGLPFLLVVAGAVLALALFAMREEDHPVAVVGHTGASVTSPTTVVTAVPTT